MASLVAELEKYGIYLTKKHLFIAGAPFVGFFLFLFMVALIYTGDAGDIVKGRKITDVIMPDREIDTLLEELMEPPEDPEVAPPDIAPPQMDVEPLAISAVSTKPQINFNSGSGTLFRDGEYIPLFKVQPVYPRRAQERGIMGYAVVAFTITETGTVENAVPLEGMCGDPTNPETVYRQCSIFNSAASRAASKLKYKPKIVDGKAVRVDDVPHKFTFILEES
mgnify:CR=1 FL=1